MRVMTDLAVQVATFLAHVVELLSRLGHLLVLVLSTCASQI
jgi:hypothetical protein